MTIQEIVQFPAGCKITVNTINLGTQKFYKSFQNSGESIGVALEAIYGFKALYLEYMLSNLYQARTHVGGFGGQNPPTEIFSILKKSIKKGIHIDKKQ